ncbi:MAG: hypothetical protein IJ876_05290 [Elusimicrobiaceae bacterium]|nr:hypothetical protein [Elusimicrobiaceae bacterium]
MFADQKIIKEILKYKNKQRILRQLRKVLPVILIILTTFVGIAKCENTDEAIPLQDISSKIISDTQNAEIVPVVASQMEHNLEQNLQGKEKQIKFDAIQGKTSLFARGLSYIKNVIYKFVPHNRETMPLGFWKGLFMMSCVALVLSFKNFVTLFLIAVLYWMGLLYLPESCIWLKSYTSLLVLFIIAVVEIFYSIVGSSIKIFMNSFSSLDKDFRDSQLFMSLLFVVPIMFFLGNKIMSDTFSLVRWGICAFLVYCVIKIREILNYWAILKMCMEIAISWWLEPILLFVFLVASCLWLPIVGFLGFLVLLGFLFIIEAFKEILNN